MKHFLRCLLYIAALGVVFFVVGRLVPKSWFKADHFPWRCYSYEQAIWKALRVKQWQAKVPDMSRIFTNIMPAKKLKRQTLSDLPRMIQETCVAEWTHGILSIAGLAMLWFWPGIGGICMTAVYILLGNLPFIVVQRFNRPRLQKLLLKQQRNMQIRNLPRYEEQLLTTIIGSVVSVAGSTISTVVNAAVSLVIMFYVLVGKQELGKQTRRALYAYCKESVADKVCHIAKLSHDTYAKFLSGQCVEVLILGTLIFLSFSIFRIPYAGLTAVLTAAFAFVPYIGAFLSCAIGMLLTLLAEPNKVILCLIVYQAAQFVENQFIYPHVVGSSVGLSPFWTLLAVLLGGKMFGVLGIIFFIPLMAVISQLLHENIEHRLAVRKLKKNDLIQKSD